MQYAEPTRAHQLPAWIWRLASKLRAAAHQSVRYAESNIATHALVGALTFGMYYFVYRFFAVQSYESPVLRLIAVCIVLPVVFVKRWPLAARRLLPLYWIVGLTYVLPFFFTYMLLQNAEVNFATGSDSMVWPMSMVVALVLLIMLVNDGLLVGLMFAVGSACAWALFLAVGPTFTEAAIWNGYVAPMPVYLFIIVAGTIYNRHRETVQQEMLRAVSSVGNNIAHELRTPLLGIKANARGLQRFLPDLIASYDMAVEQGLPVRPIRRRQLESLREALERIDNETDYSNTVIDMLLINAGGSAISNTDYKVVSALECVRNALARYPFVSERERGLITLSEKHDFRFRGSELLFIHVLFNLIKNALYFIAKANKGEIYVWLDPGPTQNRIIFMDTGTGIHPSVLPRIFERFYTSLEAGRGSGIGLSFCKSVLEGFGGRIECQSQPGEFTRFIMSFPRVDDGGE